MIDYHIHSQHSCDSEEDMDAIVQSALNKGLKEIAFCEHYDFYYPNNLDFTFEVKKYFSDIEKLQKKYQNHIIIKKGVELGLNLDYEKQINDFIKNHDFDFVIGSIHVIGKFDFHFGEFFKNKTKDEANQEYFDYVYQSIKTFNNFNVLGHLDFIIRYGLNKKQPLEYHKHQEIIDKILLELIATNRGIEINTSGLRQGCHQTFPSDIIIKRYLELNGTIITVGSDAHVHSDVGTNVNDVINKYQIKPSTFTKKNIFK